MFGILQYTEVQDNIASFSCWFDTRYYEAGSMNKLAEIVNIGEQEHADRYAEEHWENNSHEYEMMDREEMEERHEH